MAQPDMPSSKIFIHTVCGVTSMLALTLWGCETEQREKVLDVKAPGFSMEIDKKSPVSANKSVADEQHEIKIDATNTKSNN